MIFRVCLLSQCVCQLERCGSGESKKQTYNAEIQEQLGCESGKGLAKSVSLYVCLSVHLAD